MTLNFLRELGLSDKQAKEIMSRHKAVVCYKAARPKKNLNINFLENMGLTKVQINKIMASHQETIDDQKKCDEAVSNFSYGSILSVDDLYNLMVEDKNDIINLYADGYTNRMIMKKFGYPEKGFYNVLREHPELKRQLNRGKLKYHKKLVESLQTICEWHEVTEETEMPNGSRIRKTKMMPPNVRALIFNITNRMRSEFQVTPVANNTSDNENITIVEDFKDDIKCD